MASSSDAKAALRRYFDKVVKSASFNFASNRDAEKFVTAILEYGNDIELLFRLTSKQVCTTAFAMLVPGNQQTQHSVVYLSR